MPFMKMQTVSLSTVKNCAIRNRLFPLKGTTVPSLTLYLSTKAEVLNIVLESYFENEQEIKTSLLSSGDLGTKKEIISLEMQQQQQQEKIQLIKQLADLFVNTTKEIHIRRSSIKSFVFYKELSENHFWLLPLLYYCQLGKNNKVGGYKHSLNVAQFCMLIFHQNYVMSTVCEALEDDGKVPIIQSGGTH